MTSPRRYRSELRERQAQDTRSEIARRAREVFLDRGWSGTSVRAVAAAAGVSEATVYNVYGGKAGLALSLIESGEEVAQVQRAVAELRAAEGDPRAQLAAFVAFDRRLYETSGALLQVLDEGRRQHPELGTAYDEGRRRGDTERRRVFSAWPTSVWAAGTDVDQALAVYAMLVSPWAFRVAVTERGWTPQQVEDLWRTALERMLLGATRP